MTHYIPHEMVLDKTHPTGAEEWYCPTCGRRLVMQWPPKYKRIVLNGGDEYAGHSGGKGGLKMGSVQLRLDEEGTLTEENLRLDHWEAWLNDTDADRWWTES